MSTVRDVIRTVLTYTARRVTNAIAPTNEEPLSAPTLNYELTLTGEPQLWIYSPELQVHSVLDGVAVEGRCAKELTYGLVKSVYLVCSSPMWNFVFLSHELFRRQIVLGRSIAIKEAEERQGLILEAYVYLKGEAPLKNAISQTERLIRWWGPKRNFFEGRVPAKIVWPGFEKERVLYYHTTRDRYYKLQLEDGNTFINISRAERVSQDEYIFCQNIENIMALMQNAANEEETEEGEGGGGESDGGSDNSGGSEDDSIGRDEENEEEEEENGTI